MLTTAGIAFFAASAKVATFCPASGVLVSCSSTTPLSPRCPNRGRRSGRSVETTNSAATHSVQAWAKMSQNFRSTGFPS